MAKPLSVKKSANNAITVTFGANLPGLEKLKPGAAVPTEYLHSILNYHIDNQDAKGNVAAKHVNRMKAYW
jgi:hypothetical protein